MRRVHRGAFAAPSLSAALDRQADPRDRSLLTDLVYGTLRHEILLDACLEERLFAPQRLPDDVRDCLRVGAYELLIRGTPRHAAVTEWVEEVKARSARLSGLANAVLRRVERRTGLAQHESWSLPRWLAEQFDELLGTRTDEAARGMLEPEPLWLWGLGYDAVPLLESEGCEVTAGPVSGSLAVRSPQPLRSLKAFQRGLVQPQNPASRLPALALAPRAGERVLDLASGNGIKSAQLAAAGASVTAVEIDPGKVERAKRNLARLGLEVEHCVADLRNMPDLAPADKVLLDAPCSGTGTLRGNPEIKLRLTQEDVTSLAGLQCSLLDTAAGLTLPGGVMTYSVCALTPQEGPKQEQEFLERHPDFEPLTWNPPGSLTTVSPTGSGGCVVVPTGGLDGFFIFKARRRKGPS